MLTIVDSKKESQLYSLEKQVLERESEILQLEDRIASMNEQLSAFGSGAREAVRLQREVEALTRSLQQEQEAKQKCGSYY